MVVTVEIILTTTNLYKSFLDLIMFLIVYVEFYETNCNIDNTIPNDNLVVVYLLTRMQIFANDNKNTLINERHTVVTHLKIILSTIWINGRLFS